MKFKYSFARPIRGLQYNSFKMKTKSKVITVGLALAWLSSIAVYAAQIKENPLLDNPVQAAGTSCGDQEDEE